MRLDSIPSCLLRLWRDLDLGTLLFWAAVSAVDLCRGREVSQTQVIDVHHTRCAGRGSSLPACIETGNGGIHLLEV